MDELIVKLEVAEHLKQAYRIFGIEGTEDKIKELYKHMPDVMNYMLKVHQEIIKGG